MHTRLPEPWLRRIFPEMPAWPAEYDLFDYSGCDPDDTAQWSRKNEFVSHLTGVLLKVDRASMYNSLEVRVPLVDAKLLCELGPVLAANQPINGKQLLANCPAKALPQAITQRAKSGFETPVQHWIENNAVFQLWRSVPQLLDQRCHWSRRWAYSALSLYPAS